MDESDLPPAVAARRQLRKLVLWTGGITLALLGLLLAATMQDEEAPDVSDLSIAPRAVPPGQNAFPALIAAAGRLQVSEEDAKFNRLLQQAWNQEEAGKLLAKYPEVLAGFDTAVALPSSEAPVPSPNQWDSDTAGGTLKQITGFSRLWRLAAIRAEWTARDGRPDIGLALASTAATAATRDLANADGSLIVVLTGVANRDMELAEVQKIVTSMAPSTEAIRHALATLEPAQISPAMFESSFRYEFRIMSTHLPDLPQQKFIDNDKDAPWGMKWFYKPHQTLRLQAESIRSVIGWYRHPSQVMPPLGFKMPPTSIGRLASFDNALGKWFVAYSLRGVTQVVQKFQQVQTNYDATLTFLALCLYERDYGQLPPSLSDLVPAYLPAVPQDARTGKTLDYGPGQRILGDPLNSASIKLDFSPPTPVGSVP